MKISDMHWAQVEEYLKHDDRAVLPIGSTEQHAQLSLCVDYILSERVAVEAAEPLKVPVFPGLPYGITPYFMAYPGTVSLSADTYTALMRDILESLATHGFKRILVVNGHGGNSPVQSLIDQWQSQKTGVKVKFHNWWKAPATWKKVMEIDPQASHASWMENFPWTRIAGMEYPSRQKPMLDTAKFRSLEPKAARELLGDGNFGGYYQRADKDMLAIWRVGVEETRAAIEGHWS